ncbi:hypothetical protein ACFFX0_16440 [Citricoccus parietis]|uniref:Uncharacterized protein n=1 Tax=Citricoccus parietis TaxID=592307 RepID=A0ABV5G193_9MICC
MEHEGRHDQRTDVPSHELSGDQQCQDDPQAPALQDRATADLQGVPERCGGGLADRQPVGQTDQQAQVDAVRVGAGHGPAAAPPVGRPDGGHPGLGTGFRACLRHRVTHSSARGAGRPCRSGSSRGSP